MKNNFEPELVLNNIKNCVDNNIKCEDCPYEHFSYPKCIDDMLHDAICVIEKLIQTPRCIYASDPEVIEYCVEGPCPHYSEQEVSETIVNNINNYIEELKS